MAGYFLSTRVLRSSCGSASHLCFRIGSRDLKHSSEREMSLSISSVRHAPSLKMSSISLVRQLMYFWRAKYFLLDPRLGISLPVRLERPPPAGSTTVSCRRRCMVLTKFTSSRILGPKDPDPNRSERTNGRMNVQRTPTTVPFPPPSFATALPPLGPNCSSTALPRRADTR